MDEKRNILVRRFDFSDMDGIIELLNEVFKAKFTREWWKWKYELNPNGFWGQEGDIWVAEKDDKIIGHYAIIPEKIKFHSKVMDVAQSIDTATHPACRGMGIFPTLANKVYSDARKRYSFIFGFPSEMAHTGFLRLGWKALSFVPDYIKILNYNNLIKRTFTNNLVSWSEKLLLKTYSNLTRISKTFSLKEIKGDIIEIQELENFSDEINIFWERARANYKIILERTDTFLNWRFSRHFGSYQIFIGRSVQKKDIIGYIVLRKTENTLNIIDLITLPDEDRAMLQFVDMAVKIGKDEDIDIVHCWFPRWHKNVALLMKLGFISVDRALRLRHKYMLPFIFYDLSSGEYVPDINEWFYTCADTDSA